MQSQQNTTQTIITEYQTLEKRMTQSFMDMYKCINEHKLIHASENMANRLIAIEQQKLNERSLKFEHLGDQLSFLYEPSPKTYNA